MLVLSRKQGESIEFRELGVVVRVINLKRSKVQLGIEAPREIQVSRSEIVDQSRADPAVKETTNREPADDRILDELARVESAVAAIAELADGRDGILARDLAATSIQRLADISHTLRQCMRRQSEARPIADFIKVRSDVIEQLRVSPNDAPQEVECESEKQIPWNDSHHDPSSCARESQPGYAITSRQSIHECSLA